MNSKAKSKIKILIILGILFALLPMITVNLSFITGNSNKSSEHSDKINLKISAVSEKIHIDNNWTAAKSVGICTGSGTYSDPYIIEDLEIDGGGTGSCISIVDSDVYFKIQNCTLFNSGANMPNSGITLINVNNSQLINNNCSSNWSGIFLYSSDNNTVVGNTANNNHLGIFLYSDSGNNYISGNNASYNMNGIDLSYSNSNTITGNTANNNERGLDIYNSYYNTITGNTVNNNNYGVYHLDYSIDNTLYLNNFINNNENPPSDESHTWNSPAKIIYTYNGNNYTNYLGNYWDTYTGNDANNDGIGDTRFIIGEVRDNFPLMEPIENYVIIEMFEPSGSGDAIPGYNPFFLLGILSVVVIFISQKLKKS